MFPLDMMDKAGLSMRTVLLGPHSDAERKAYADVVFDLASQAHAQLQKGRELQGTAHPQAYLALLRTLQSSVVLEDLRKKDFNILNDQYDFLQRNRLAYQFQLLKTMWTKKI